MNAINPHRLICVAPHMVGETWPLVRDMIAAGYAAMGEIAPHDLPKWLADKKGLLWISVFEGAIVAAMTTSLVPSPDGLVLRMVSCGGSHMDLWKQCHSQIEEYAKQEGCVRVVSEGRPGWARVLDGYKVKAVVLEKRL